MIGRATAGLATAPRRWLLRAWGAPDIHTRQKWLALWPRLARLPERGLRVLDAGCGDGLWSLELAARRRHWLITGIDRDPVRIDRAAAAGRRLALPNVVFSQADFLDFRPQERFDVILSVDSAHYLVEDGRGEELFRTFGTWLRPDGQLVALVARRRAEVPCLPLLPPPFHLRDVVSRDALRAFCRAGGFAAPAIAPVVGPFGTWAKQLAGLAARSRLLSGLTYPLQLFCVALDRLAPRSDAQRSSGWVLVAPQATARRVGV